VNGGDTGSAAPTGDGVRNHGAKALVVRVAPATIVIFAVMGSPFVLMSLLLFWHGKQLRDASLLCVAYLVLVWWSASHRVELAPGRLIHRTLFTRKDIDLSGVVAASVVSRPAPTLELRRAGSREFVGAFIVKPFSRRGVAAILDHVRESSPGVKLDRVAEAMRQGDFDLVTRETIRGANLLRLIVLVVVVLVGAAMLRMFMR
jgi:hypothetical protein